MGLLKSYARALRLNGCMFGMKKLQLLPPAPRLILLENLPCVRAVVGPAIFTSSTGSTIVSAIVSQFSQSQRTFPALKLEVITFRRRILNSCLRIAVTTGKSFRSQVRCQGSWESRCVPLSANEASQWSFFQETLGCASAQSRHFHWAISTVHP